MEDLSEEVIESEEQKKARFKVQLLSCTLRPILWGSRGSGGSGGSGGRGSVSTRCLGLGSGSGGSSRSRARRVERMRGRLVGPRG